MSLGDRIAFICGGFLLICGIIIGCIWSFIFNSILNEKLVLSPTSESYKLWLKTPVPMYLDVYLFNWTNSEEFLKNKKIKPKFEEIGPFVFKEVHQRINVTWNENNSVSYNQIRSWTFVPEESIDLSTPIFNLNVIATTITRMASGYSSIVKLLLDFLNSIYKEKLIIAKPAREWLFDGIDDKLLDFIRIYVDIPYKKFGWFYERNLSATYDGRFSISTGQDNIFSLGEVQQWNYVNKTRFYNGKCGIVKGSTGELFSPVRNVTESLTIFVTDFCGPLKLKYSGSKSHEGLNSYHYIGDKNVFDDGKLESSNKCFCTGECVPSGVRNVTSCRKAPLFISFPHFYLADTSYTNAVTGMKPNKSNHEFYLDIHPLTGLPLEVRAQLQLNLFLQPLKGFPMFQDVPKLLIPMMWFRQRAKISPDLASKGKILEIFRHLGLWLACGLFVFGFCIIILRVVFVKFFISDRQSSELLISQKGTDEDEMHMSDSESER